MNDFDVVVLGGGTAGLTAALAARHAGASVVLVEREPGIGGDCTFYGCVPSKALIAAARISHEARVAAAAGLLDRAPEVNGEAILEHVRATVAAIARDERDERFASVGIEVVHGEGRFAAPNELRIGERILRARRFVLAVGAETVPPDIPGLDDVPYLTNRSVFSLLRLPLRLLVLGGGATGLELAQAFCRLGTAVVVVERSERLLPAEEPEAGELAERVLRGEGVELRLGAQATAASCRNGEIVLEVDGEELRGDALLLATTQRPSLDGLGLETLGVEPDARGFVGIDERCRTSVAHIYAAGDVTGGLQLTHVAAHEGAIAGLNAAGKKRKRDVRVAPRITFLDPEIASVGLTEAEARAVHRDVVAAEFPMRRVDRARIEGSADGYVKLVTARRALLGRFGGGKLVGAHVAGPRAGELIAECALAMQTNAFAGRLAQTIHAYPSVGMAVQQAAAQLSGLGRALTREPESADRAEPGVADESLTREQSPGSVPGGRRPRE